MTYATLMVHLDVGSPNEGILRVAASLAERFKASVIGIAACRPMQILYSDGYTAGAFVEADLAEIAKEMAEAEASFRAALAGTGADLSWRSLTESLPLADYIAEEARAADLLISGPDTGWSALEATRRVVVSDLVLHAGRPVLIVPATSNGLNLETIVVGWKDTREARRAVTDALPLLKRAGRVFVVKIAAEPEIAAAGQRLADVAAWLARHGVTSDYIAAISSGNDGAQLQAIAKEKQAGLVVAGAYGHSRMREWVLGGVTRDLLAHAGRCSLVSH